MATVRDSQCSLSDLDLDSAQAQSPSIPTPKKGLTCCGGMACPFAGAVCCTGSSHCCPAQSLCTKPCAECPFICVPRQPHRLPKPSIQPDDAPQEIRRKVVKIEVFSEGGSATTQSEPKRDDKNSEEQKVKAEEERERQLQEEQRKGLLGRIHQLIKQGAGKMNLPPIKPDDPVREDLLQRTGGADSSTWKDVTKDGEDEPLGHPWPPMSTRMNDGMGGLWVQEEGLDWMGYGLIRNGTYNRVTGLEDCKTQCDKLPECRVAKYVTKLGANETVIRECWLDTEVAKKAEECGRDEKCTSLLKKVQSWDDKEWTFGITSDKDSDWHVIDQQNWLGRTGSFQFGHLMRNGRRNQVNNLSECIQQCASLRHCRSMLYFRPNGECWLSSNAEAKSGTRCARRRGRRDCITYIKKPMTELSKPKPSALVANSADGRSRTITIENLGDTDPTTLSVAVPGQ